MTEGAGVSGRHAGRELRVRLLFIALAVCTIVVGLVVHWYGAALAPALRDVVGDALWAMMMLWWVSAVVPRASLSARSVVTLLICAVVELSQLYHAPAVDAVRQTTLGHLVLGSDFDMRAFAAYALGVLVARLVEVGIARRVVGRSGEVGA